MEFEQKGKERAQYGEKLRKKLEEAVNEKGLTVTLFQWARRFYIIYPQMEKLIYTRNQEDCQKYASVMSKLQIAENLEVTKSATVMPIFTSRADDIISHLSFTHLREIMSIDDPLVRYFYEQECMRCTWSVRENIPRRSGAEVNRIRHLQTQLRGTTPKGFSSPCLLLTATGAGGRPSGRASRTAPVAAAPGYEPQRCSLPSAAEPRIARLRC